MQAYAFAHADAEGRLAIRWTDKWDSLRVKAHEFMQAHPMDLLSNVANIHAGPDDAVQMRAENGEAHGNNAGDEVQDANANAPDADENRVRPAPPIVELELDDEDDYADDYDFHADEI